MASPYKPYRKPLEEVFKSEINDLEEVVKSEINDLYSDLKLRTKEIVNSSTNTLIDRLDRHQRESKDDITLANDELKSANDELKSANDELKSANDKLKSANDKLKSLNDDLTFIKGEVAFVNNKLTTVNSELAGQTKELNNLNKIRIGGSYNSNQEQLDALKRNSDANIKVYKKLSNLNETINKQLPVLLEHTETCVRQTVNETLNQQIPVLLEKCVSQTVNETLNQQIPVLLETVNEKINEQLPVLLERCVQPMVDQVLKSRPKSVRLLFDEDDITKEMSHQSLMTNSYHPGLILNDVSSPMYQNVSVPSIGNESVYSTVREKRKVPMISENVEETCDSTKKPKTDDDDVIAFLSNIRPRPGEDYWENSEIVNSIWCRYCLCYNKSNTHDEDNCEYNIENRQTKNGKKHKLCEICGQTQFKHHDPGREKCNKTRKIMMKLYDLWPISIERIGFDSRSETFTSTYKKR